MRPLDEGLRCGGRSGDPPSCSPQDRPRTSVPCAHSTHLEWPARFLRPTPPVHSCLGAHFRSHPGCCHGEPAPGAQERLSQTSPRSVIWSHLPISQLRSPSPAQRSLLSRQPHSRWQVHHCPGGRAGAAVPGDGETGKREAARSDTSNLYMKSSRDAAMPSLGQKKQKSPLSAYGIPQDWLLADSMLCRVI